MGGGVKEPEALVFGAELRCQYSDFRTYLLTENYFSKGINGLPAKFVVSDCKPGINILPFGDCTAGGPCVSQWMLADNWTNPAGQDEEFGGEQIITTASHLVCNAWGMFVLPVNSGQNSDIGKQLMYLAEFDEKYPGLRAILEDPYSSLYLQDGMRDLALKFLSDEIDARGGSIEIGSIVGKLKDGLLSIKNLYILSAIAHLDNVIDVSDQARFVENMQDLVTRMDNGNGANDRYLNKQMYELLDIRSSQIADNVAKGGGGIFGDLFYEQNKGSLMALGNMMMGLAQVSVLYSSYTSWAGQQRTQGYSGYERDVRDAEIGQSNRGGGTGNSIDPNDIRFSQSSVNGSGQITESMKANGWQGDPIDVVRMPDGQLTSLDNTRVVSARQAGIDVQANIHNYTDPLPSAQVGRFTTPRGVPSTWGDAVELRINNQNAGFRNTYPSGSFELPKINP
jgi:filamentous hemagglutinin